MAQMIDLEALCAERGLRITEQRRVIARVLSESVDHPDVEALQREIAEKLGYRLVDHRMELYGVRLDRED